MNTSGWVHGNDEALRWSASAYQRTAELRRRKLAKVEALAGTGGAPRSTDGSSGSTGGVITDIREVRSLLEQERELERVLLEVISDHPAWPWLQGISGLDLPAAAELLARLSIRRAIRPSGFWAYCGFGTVAGVLYVCPRCGARRSIQSSDSPPAIHVSPEGATPCRVRMRRSDTPGTERLPQSERSGGDRGYDATAKRLCYTIGMGLREAGHSYAGFYRYQRQILAITRPEWQDGRRHVNALRRMQKLFLAHLWLVWREALSLPVTPPSDEGGQSHPWSSPWQMVTAAGESDTGCRPGAVAAAGAQGGASDGDRSGAP